MPDAFHFLSDEWITEARRIRDEHVGEGIPVPAPVKVNQLITDSPFGEEPVKAHLDTSSGELVMELDHVEAADVTITLEYETAKAIFVDGTAQAGMAAFMAGKIKVEGDLAKLIAAFQQINPTAFEASHVQRRIKQITLVEAEPPAGEEPTAVDDQGGAGEDVGGDGGEPEDRQAR
ncbi:MAG: SCP2 sterol-binding domain-containing protein [Actinomycetota bacterium]